MKPQGAPGITRLPASVVVSARNKGARDSIPDSSTLTINHCTIRGNCKRVEGRDEESVETPRHHRGKAGVMLVELALVYII